MTHSFINRHQVPLTLDEIAQRAPSALATRPYDAMSAKYTYVPTLGVIEAMIKAGFQPFSAVQSRTRVEGKQEFTKHSIRFRHADMSQPFVVGDVIPEVVLINIHDGTSAYKLIAGLYRLVCSNGMMVSDAEIDAVNVAHKGNILDNVIEGSYRLISDTHKAIGTVRNWTQLQLRTASSAPSLRPRTACASRTATARSARRSLRPSCLSRAVSRMSAATFGGHSTACRRTSSPEDSRRYSATRTASVSGVSRLAGSTASTRTRS